MSSAKQKKLELFWREVLHRAKLLLSDMNVGSFYQWRNTVEDKKVERLLKLMELLLSPENNKLEIKFLVDLINSQLNGHKLFSCFKNSGKKIVKEGMKGDIYCMPVLYVLIQHLNNDLNIVHLSNFEHHQEINSNLMFRFNP